MVRQMQQWVDIHKPHIANDVAQEISRGLQGKTERDHTVAGKIDMKKVDEDVRKALKKAESAAAAPKFFAAMTGGFSAFSLVSGLHYRRREQQLAGPS